MKTKLTIVFILPLLFSLSCKKVDKLTQFNMEFNEEAVIPSSSGINLPFNVFTPDVETNSESTFAVNDTRKDKIESIVLTTLDLTLKSPENSDFGFLKSISVYISAEGLEEQKIAWLDNISESPGKKLDLNTTGIDLQAYIKKDNFDLRLNTVTDEFINNDHVVDVHSVFFVDAKVLGK